MKQIAILVALLTVPAFAQTTKAPTLDAVDKQLLSALEKSAQLADTRCKALEEYKVYDATQKGLAAHLTAKYPGYTFDWNTRTLKSMVEAK